VPADATAYTTAAVPIGRAVSRGSRLFAAASLPRRRSRVIAPMPARPISGLAPIPTARAAGRREEESAGHRRDRDGRVEAVREQMASARPQEERDGDDE
jgi:hypothetical protein